MYTNQQRVLKVMIFTLKQKTSAYMFELNPPLLSETLISKVFFLKDLKNDDFHRVPL